MVDVFTKLGVLKNQKEDYIVTSSTANIISRSCTMMRPQHVSFPGGKVIIEAGSIIRADFSPVEINRYCFVSENVILRPPSLLSEAEKEGKGDAAPQLRFIPQTIGKYSYIGPSCVVESASIGIGCLIGEGCVLGKRSILKDYVYVAPNSIVPSDMVIPPFSRVEGQPAKIVDELPSCMPNTEEVNAVERHSRCMEFIKKA